MKRALWEILIPVALNNGQPICAEVRHAWYEKIRKISGGLTILSTVEGHWIAECGSLLKEEMVPVRILASKEEIQEIIKLTLDYYNQEVVLVYKISNKCILGKRS